MKKANHSTDRRTIQNFQQIINVGPATERDFIQLGIRSPIELKGRDPWQLFQQLCQINGRYYDPCCLDVFISVIDFMNGNPPRKWWAYTKQRKSQFADQLAELAI